MNGLGHNNIDYRIEPNNVFDITSGDSWYLVTVVFLDYVDYKTDFEKGVTVLVYLNDVEEGCETGFSKIKKYGGTIKIKAKKGRMVVFHNLHSNGEIHRETMHAGLPVIKGEKWAFNLWLRER